MIKRVIISLIILVSFGFSKSGTVYTTNGSQSDVQGAIDDASTGDTVNIPAGTFTWGSSSFNADIYKNVKLQGAGSVSTTVRIHASAPGAFIKFYDAGMLKGITLDADTNNYTGTSISIADGTGGWRVTDVKFLSAGGYFLFASADNSYGLIDNCYIIGQGGTNELIFARGPSDSWQTNSSIGGAANMFIEDCIFDGEGYICDMNSNMRAVVRFCTVLVDGTLKIDGHGKASNTPPRGVRHMEVYGNEWESSGFFASIELRGGTGMVFDNTSVAQSGLFLVEYGSLNTWPNFGNEIQRPEDWPIDDMIGVGKDPKSGGSEPMYLWNNSQGGNPWALTWKATGQDFTLDEVIVADRDYFNQVTGFNGTTGVGRGTMSQMNAITPNKVGVAFWVTDQGEWNSNHSGADGRLYRWNGSAWVLHYTPYTYPHPLRSGSPPPGGAPGGRKIGAPTGLRIVP